jgi:molybdopterin molybdotransferase
MILLEDALKIVADSARILPHESVGLDEAFLRILAKDMESDMDMPPFNKSAMDGYACRRADLSNKLLVIETIQAGRAPTKIIGKNQCAKIMTGAPVPEGADCVIMVEYTEQCGDGTVRFTAENTRDNICAKGEDIVRGEIVLKRGTRILDRHLALLAAVGTVRPEVFCRAKVGVIATGDELVEPSLAPGQSQIRNSNASQLRAQAAGTGALPASYGIAPDNEEALAALIRKASSENDVILLSGGVSMGDFDLVPKVLKSEGYELLFEKIATQPGMPTVFGRSERGFCFGLPGNPVSTFILFENLVKPFLYKLMGHDYHPRIVTMRLVVPVRRKKTDRASWIPVRIVSPDRIAPIEYHGSAHLNSLCGADGLICIPIGVSELKEDSPTDVRLF